MEFRRGLVRSYDAATHTAAVLLVGSLSRALLSLPVSHQIPPDLMIAGTHCAVAFFADRSDGIVVSTFQDPADPRIITQTQLDAHTADPDAHRTLYTYEDTGTDLTLTTSWQSIPNLSITVAPPSPQTWTVIVLAQLNIRSTGTIEIADLLAQIAANGSLVGTYALNTVYDPIEGGGVALHVVETVTYSSPRTYTIQARKSGGTQPKVACLSRMTIMALRSA